MRVRDILNSEFEIENLREIYQENVSLSSASGIDNTPPQKYFELLNQELEIINRKVLSGKYSFTKYKLKLISKGRGKEPREISIPTIRDRIALRALCNVLTKRYGAKALFDLPQNIVHEVNKDVASGVYTHFMKLDVANFYPSVNHDLLIKRLKKKIRIPEVVSLVESALKTPTVVKPNSSDSANLIGIPQGLSISNILSAIYILPTDDFISRIPGIKYYRYVDDILVLGDERQIYDTKGKIIKEFESLGLDVYDPESTPEKSKIGGIGEDFSYLGYLFKGEKLTVRKNSVERLRDSLVSIFTGYKHSKIKSVEFLEWRLNLRICGCIFQGKRKGWLFFFSEINDESLLHSLDHFVHKLVRKYGVNIAPKKFVRSWHEINKNQYDTSYIENFDKYSVEKMRTTLEKVFKKDTERLNDLEVMYEFRKKIDKQSRDLLADIMNFGYN